MKDNLKWLILLPVLAIVAVLAIFIPRLVSNGSTSDAATAAQGGQVLQQQIDQDNTTITNYQDLTKKNPNDQLALVKLGDTYTELGDLKAQQGNINDAAYSYKDAVDQYRRYLKQNPNDTQVRINLGYAYTQLSMGDVAMRELQAAVAQQPNNQQGWLDIGFLDLQTGKVDESKAPLQKAISIDPNTQYGKSAKQYLDEANNGGLQNLVPVTP